jgi:RNA polymerase sigma-70 factor (ECF subfamily)
VYPYVEGVVTVERDESDLELQLVRRARAGDRSAFGSLVERYMRRAYHAALGLVGSHDDAMDLSQEAFVRAYRAMGRFREGEPFYPWYYRILRNLCFNHFRDRGRRRRLLREAGAAGQRPAAANPAPDPTLLAERSEIREAVWAAIGSLREEEREVIVLREFQGLAYKEIAEMVGCPIGTVMSRLFSARKRLRTALEGVMS